MDAKIKMWMQSQTWMKRPNVDEKKGKGGREIRGQ